VLGVAPVARGNPFQALFYRSFLGYGIATVDLNDPWSFPELRHIARDYDIAVHLHWLNFVLGKSEDLSAAQKDLGRFKDAVEKILAAGGKIVWTVHNLLPHDAKYVELEMELRKAVSNAASLIHLMSDESGEIVREMFDVDRNKTVVVPHPNYRGCYPDYVTRERARLTLGLEPDEQVIVMLGAIKPYKGLETLLAAVEKIRRPERVRLIVAGMPDDSMAARKFVDKCLTHPSILIHPKKVATENVQYYLRAADVGVAPYDRVLNSGALLLYSTFDLPVVAPDVPSLHSAVVPGAHAFFTPGDPSSLAEAVLRALEPTVQFARRDIHKAMGLRDPEVVSKVLAGSVLEACAYRRRREEVPVCAATPTLEG